MLRERIIRVAENLYVFVCIVYVWMLVHYCLTLWETRKRYGIIFLSLTLVLAALSFIKKLKFQSAADYFRLGLNVAMLCVSLAGGAYFWMEYNSLVWERAGDLNTWDILFSGVMIYMVIHFTWATSGKIIPLVTLVFAAYALFGDFLPGFLHHSPITFERFAEFSAGELSGIFGPLNQLSATYIAIFAFYAGFIHGFDGLNYVIRLCYHLVGRNKTNIPQVAVLSSMAFGCMSGSAGANATGTGAFTIPVMKKFGMPPAMAAAVETIASSGGQVMPPILGATAFVMCDFLGMYYYQILSASIFASILFFGSTMISVHFLSQRYIDPNADIYLPEQIKAKMSTTEIMQGAPIVFSMAVMLFAFIAFRINILVGGFFAIVSYLASRLVYELITAKGMRGIKNFIKGVYQGTITGATMMFVLGAMLATLGIVVRVLAVTGLGERISYTMVHTFGDTLWLFLVLTMCICILFGMAVSTVGAYIMVVTLAAPALIKLGIQPLVAHFAVFYWAMLSTFTPPVAGICVITAGIAHANFMQTCWESIKLGFPKFILPFFFVACPSILSLSWEGFQAFLVASAGFVAISAGIQSDWGGWRRGLLILLGATILVIPSGIMGWTLTVVTAGLVAVFWRQFKDKIRHPAPSDPGLKTEAEAAL